MNIKEQWVDAFESFFLAAIMVWSIGIAVALVHPEVRTTPQGSVEIYSLVSADSQPSA